MSERDRGPDEAEALARQLLEAHPAVDPIGAGFNDLRRWIAALDAAAGERLEADPDALERVQAAWHGLQRAASPRAPGGAP